MSSVKTARLTKDRRRVERALAQIPARWIRRTGAEPITTADISVRGIFLCTDEQAKLSELLKIEVVLPDGPLSIMVVVRNCGMRGGKRGIGVEMYHLADDDAARWRQFCITVGCEVAS